MTVFLYTTSLSENTLSAPSNVTPKILNFYRKASTISTATFNEHNSAPNVLVSTDGSFLIYQCIGALLMNINTPV